MSYEDGEKRRDEVVAKIKAMPFKEGLEEALDLRSDDFGHNCDLLLEAESELFQYFGQKFLESITITTVTPTTRDEGER